MSEDTYCRLCAMKIENFVKIYDEEGEQLNLATKIIQCLQIWLYPEDVLPKTICEDCCTKVNLFFDFFQICSQSQISLMSMFKDRTYEDKMFINNEEEMSSKNNLEGIYEDDNVNSEPTETEECNEYTDLSGPSEQDKISCKRKLRAPAKHSLDEEIIEIPSTQTDTEETEVSNTSQVGKRSRKCKETAKPTLDDDEDYVVDCTEEDGDSELEDDPKLTRRGLRGYVWRCTSCPEVMSTVAELRRHHETEHSQAPVFACMHCSKSYTRYRSFSRHAQAHINRNKFSCDVCGKSFSQKTVLQSHAAVHSEDRPHSCGACGKSFKQFSSLYLHSKCHLPNDIRPRFQCKICAKQFSAKHTLETHLKLHTGERNFVCDICGRRFIAKGSLDYHIQTHTDVKPFTCDVCNKGFKTERLLAKHATLHTGVKPHQCDVCGKQFRERGALREHNRIHTGAMPYSCEYCGKLFRFKGILTVHRRQHTGERPYSCSECRRDFTNWANYNKHMKRRHSRPSEPTVAAPSLGLVPAATQQYDTSDPSYKVVDDDLYRVPNYNLSVPNLSYYVPPLQHSVPVLQTRQ